MCQEQPHREERFTARAQGRVRLYFDAAMAELIDDCRVTEIEVNGGKAYTPGHPGHSNRLAKMDGDPSRHTTE